MKKLSLVLTVLLALEWLGCGGEDKPTAPPVPTIATVTAASGTVAPARLSVQDSVWNRITPKALAITADRLSSSKQRPPSLLSVSDTVRIQAVVVSDTLYVRLSWSDGTWDRWPGRFAVTSFDTLAPDTLAHFTQDALSYSEDQAMLFFQATGDTTWDIWQWRLVTTGAGYLGEGFTLSGTTLTRDQGTADVDTSNANQGGQPIYMQPEGPANQDYRLFKSDAVVMDHYLDWQLGDLVAGWVIDDSLYLPQNTAARASRFDIGAVSSYTASPARYTVVLHRALNTGHADDLDMSAHSSLRMRIGLTNNSDFYLSQGDTRQGFTSVFQLNLP
jgi:hypothetical protein